MSKVGLTFRWLVVPLSFIAFNPSSMAACEVGNWIPGCSAGVDTTPSLGQFAIRLTKEMGKKLNPPQNCPGDWTDPFDACVIWSPVLYDPNTQIGRSDPFLEPASLESDSALVCEIGGPILCNVFDPVPVKDWQMQFPTKDFVEGPAGTAEVHTKIVSLNMTDNQTHCGIPTKNAVRAGNAMTVVPAAKRQRSIGEVESLNIPPGGFPAESFFNMFVEVDLDWGTPGNVDMTVYNPIVPLTVQNSALMGFPPQVVYIHGGNEDDGAPPVREVNTDKLIGWIILAGHGVGGGKDISCVELANFGNKIKGMAKDILKVKPLAVTLDSFQVQVNNGEIILDWQTGTEANNAAFNIWEGKLLPGKTKCTLNMEDYSLPTVRVVSSVNSQGTEVSGAEYTYTQSVASGTYCYAIEDVEYGEVNSSRDDKFHLPDNPEPVVVP